MAVLVDSSLLIDRERGSAVFDRFADDEDYAISVITVSELLHGVHRSAGATGIRRRAFVERLLAAFEPLPITQPVARVHAEIWAGLRSRGDVLAAHDLWIAATAVTYDLSLATRNPRDFSRVRGLRVLTPGRDN